MPWRYALFVTPVETRWRVSVLDEVANIPERLCDVDDKQEAMRHALELAAEFESLGDQASIAEIAQRPLERARASSSSCTS